MSRLIKGLVKGVKSIFKGVKKIFKMITSSTIGKIILVAAAIWLAGAAFGVPGFSTRWASMNGAWSSSGSLASQQLATAGTSEMLAADAASAAMLPGTATTTPSLTALAPGTVSGSILPAATSLPAPGAATVSSTAASTAAGLADVTPASMGLPADVISSAMLPAAAGPTAGAGGGGSFFSKMLGKAGGVADWTAEHPLLTFMGLSGVSKALSPDEEDVLEMYEKQRRKRMSLAFDPEEIAKINVDLGLTPMDYGQWGSGLLLNRFGKNRGGG